MPVRQPKKKALSDAISLSKISSQSGELEKLMHQADQLSRLQSIVDQCLPELFQGKIFVNGVKNNAVIMTCHSANFATKLRFHQQDILSKLNVRLGRSNITDMKVRIRPKGRQHHEEVMKRVLSKESAQLLSQEAEQTEDLKLRNALLSLAKHGSD